jgi:hypothetical protein
VDHLNDSLVLFRQELDHVTRKLSRAAWAVVQSRSSSMYLNVRLAEDQVASALMRLSYDLAMVRAVLENAKAQPLNQIEAPSGPKACSHGPDGSVGP